MRKFALPTIVVPGARPRMDGEGIFAKQATDHKGRPLWDMPKPVGVHATTQVVRIVDKSDPDRPRVKKVKQKTQFPVYRGMRARDARTFRSQMRRLRREQTKLQNLKDDAGNFIKGVLNPTGA